MLWPPLLQQAVPLVDVRESDRFRGWVEIVATVGVVVSLLFVGYEIRQNTSMARGQARQELAALNQEWLLTLGQDAEFATLWLKVWGGGEGSAENPEVFAQLSDIEYQRAWYIMTMHLRRLENVYFQYREGLVDESALRSYGFAHVELFRRPQFHYYWVETNSREGFDPDFVRFLEQRIEAGP
jgi:hypothetical protein